MASPAAVPARRGPAPSLRHEDIVAAALRLLDEGGAQAFNMRALAAELGAAPMTVYNYVPTKAALLEQAIDSVIDRIQQPDPDARPWQDELRRYARDAWRAQLPHPWIPTLLAEQHIIDRPAQVKAREALLKLFRAASGDDAAAREGVAVFFSFMIGTFVQVAPTLTKHRAPARANALFESGLEIILAGLDHRFQRPA